MPNKPGPAKGAVKRPDVSQRNREAPVPRFAPNPANERTELVSGRVSKEVKAYLASLGRRLNDGERIEKAIQGLLKANSNDTDEF